MVDDDRDRVSKEDDYLRGATVLLDDQEVLVVPVDDDPPFSLREYKAMRARHGFGPARYEQ